jgi:hypothetical protein
MKKVFVLFTVAVCLYLTSAAHATIVNANLDWGISMGGTLPKAIRPSMNGIAYYIPDLFGLESLVFTAVPVFVNDSEYFGDYSQWQTELAPDGKAVYLYGPTTTYDSDILKKWFRYTLSYQWDDAAAGFDPAFPVYNDIAIFSGPKDSNSIQEWAQRGNPADIQSWVVYQDHSYKGGEPYTSPYDPLPEPITILVFGLGAVLLGKIKIAELRQSYLR